MRLITITLLVLAGLVLLIILFPAVFLQATSQYLQDPQQQTAGEMLAGFASATGRPMTAVDVYDFLITRHPDSAEYYRLKSDALFAAGDEKGSLSALEAALARDPQNAQMLERKARLLIRAGRMTDANVTFSTILTLQTDNPDYLSVIADVALEKNQYINALDRYSGLLTIRPDDGLTWEKRSDTIFALLTIPTASPGVSEELRHKDLYTEGITGYNTAIALNPARKNVIEAKIAKRSDEYVPRSISELEERYTRFRYLKPGEKPLPE